MGSIRAPTLHDPKGRGRGPDKPGDREHEEIWGRGHLSGAVFQVRTCVEKFHGNLRAADERGGG